MKFYQKIINYNIEKYPFNKIVSDVLGINNLEKLHKDYLIPSKINELGQDTSTNAHKKFYKYIDTENNEFLKTYYNFIFDILLKEFSEDTIFQKSPGLRIAYPNNVAVSTWHSDSDEDNLHPKGEINIFLPLTNCYGNNALWIESEPGLKDYHPIKLSPGQLLIFNGSECVHGNYKNDTPISRISLDFRLLPREKYNPNYKNKSATMNLSYTLGSYYVDKNLITNK